MDTLTKPVRFSDVTEDGTYMVDAHGDLHRMEYTSGYTVAIRPVTPYPVEGERSDIITPLRVVGRWTDTSTPDKDVYWDVVEVIDNLLGAGNIARQRGELAIWDNLNNKEIRV